MSNQRTKEMETQEITEKSKLVLSWMAEKLGEAMPKKPFRELIWDGVLLCRLANVLKPGCVRRFNRTPRMLMMQLENGGFFITACKSRLGIPEASLFQATDIQDETEETGLISLRKILDVMIQLRKEYPGANQSDTIELDATDDSATPEVPSFPEPDPDTVERVLVSSHFAQSATDFDVQSTSHNTNTDSLSQQYIAGNSKATDGFQSTVYGIILSAIHDSLSVEAKKGLVSELRTEVRSLQTRIVTATDEELRVIAHEYGLGASLADVPTNKERKWYIDWIFQFGRLG